MPNCPNCGADVAEGARFCATCGSSLRADAVSKMIEDARRTLDTNPDDLFARYNLALAYKLAGMTELAFKELLRVADAQPDFADVHYQLAQFHLKAGRTEQAAASLRRVLELEPHHAGARRLLENPGTG